MCGEAAMGKGKGVQGCRLIQCAGGGGRGQGLWA